MTHSQIQRWITLHRSTFGKALIAACGPQMGILPQYCEPGRKRQDKIVIACEQTIRYPDEGTTSFGRPALKHFRIDAVAYVRPGRWGNNAAPTRPLAFTVALEVKTSESDLLHDEKIMFYLGWTDFFFLVVPAELEKAGRRKVRELNDARIGLLIVGSECCRVAIAPLRQQILPQNKSALALEVILSDDDDCLVDTIIDWDGIPESGLVSVDAYFEACCAIHPEFAGYEDTYIQQKI